MPIRWHLNRLATSRDAAVDLALAAALPTAEAGAIGPIARLLLKRGNAVACARLIERFHTLPADVRTQMISRIGDLHGACREASRRRSTDGPRVVIDLVRTTGDTRLVYLIAEQLRSGPVELRREAAQCLLELTQNLRTSANDTADESDQPDSLDLTSEQTSASSPSPARHDALRNMQAAVEEALLLYRHHHQPAVLLAFAMLLPGPCGKAISALRDPRQPAVEGLRQLILDAHEPAIIAHMFQWLAIPTLTPIASTVLPRLCRAGRLHQCLEQGHLLLLGGTRQIISKLPDPKLLLPNDADVAAMTPQAARWLPAWIAAVGVDDATHIDHLVRLARLPDAHARLTVLEQLIKMAGLAATAPVSASGSGGATATATGWANDLHHAISIFTRDREQPIARLALRHLLTTHWPGLHRLLLELTQDSPHDSLRDMAATTMATAGFDGLWRGWPRLDGPRRLAAAQALIKLGDHFHRLLAQRLAHPNPVHQLRAMDIIAALHQGPLYEDELIEITQGTDLRLAASAIKAMARSTSPKVTMILEATLNHTDARMRANAIEALGVARARQVIGRLREMAGNDENRPRANAIALLIESGDTQATTQLRLMLADKTGRHRLSALWATQQAGRIDTVGQVAEMAISDDDAAVRERAAQTLKQLLDRMKPPRNQPATVVPA